MKLSEFIRQAELLEECVGDIEIKNIIINGDHIKFCPAYSTQNE